MAETSLTQALAAPGQIEFGGKAYLLSPLTYDVQQLFEGWLRRRAVAAVLQMRTDLSEEDYAARLDGVADRAAAGHYSFFGKMAQAALKSIAGIEELLHIRLREANPDAPEIDADFVRQITAERMDAIKVELAAMDRDPNPPGPAAA